MPITRVGLVTLASATVTGWTCAIPAGVQDGDKIYTTITKATSAAPTTVPTGYGVLDTTPEGQTNNFTWWYGKALTAADASTNHVWAWASTGSSGAALILRGCDPAQFLDVTDPPAATTGNGVTSINTPASASVTPGAWVIWTVSVGTAGTQTFPATANGNAVTREFGSASGRLGLARAEYPTAGTVSAVAATLSASTRATAKCLIAKPSPWITGTVQRWDGGAWVPATARRWDGAQWVVTTVQRRA